MPASAFRSQRFRLRAQVVVGALAIAAVTLPAARATDLPAVRAAATSRVGYWTVTTGGGVTAFGDASFLGSTGDVPLNQPIVGMASTPTGEGYWLVASDGGIFGFGDAAFYGSTGDIKLNRPIVGMASTPSGDGYWTVASDGGIFAFGDAAFHGSTGNIKLNRPIVGMASTPSGDGYWMVASDGGIFAFGDAAFHGSTGNIDLNQPITGMASTPAGAGYWMVAIDGGIFSFGDAAFRGSPAGQAGDVSGMVPTPSGGGYWLAERSGKAWAFGDAPAATRNGPGASPLPIAGVAALPAAKSFGSFGAPADLGSTPVNVDAVAAPTTTTTTTTTAPPAPSGSSPIAAMWAPAPFGTVPPGTNGKPDADVFPQCRAFAMTRQIDSIGNGGGEISGLVTTPRYPGALWAIRDSGHTASLLAIRLDSNGLRTMLRDIPIPGTENHDWESLNYTTGPDGRGHLWAVASGQGGKSPDIVEVLEPDPDTATSAQLLGVYPYKYPDRGSNTESSFVDGDKLVLVKKSFPASMVYRFDAPLAGGTTNVPKFMGYLLGAKSTSEMKFSPDRQYLMSASHDMLWIHRSADGSGTLESYLSQDKRGTAPAPLCAANAWPEATDNIEAGVFLDTSPNLEMLFISESRNTYRVSLQAP